MDEVVVRPRYNRQRNTYPVRRRNRSIKYNNTLAETIIRQTIISLVLLVVIGLVKSLNTAPTNYITKKVKSTLTYNMEVKAVYRGIDSTLKKVGKWLPGKRGVDQDEKGLPSGVEGLEEEDETAGADTYAEEIEEDTEIQKAVEPVDEKVISEIKTSYTFNLPVEGFLSSPYGNRISPIKKTLTFHQGIDIGANTGTSIKAALDGEVVETGSEPVYGNYIKISHGNSIETLYAHCSELIAKKGNKVSRGTTIAKVGNTGLSVGAHLHFEIRKDGRTLDPALFVNVPEQKN